MATFSLPPGDHGAMMLGMQGMGVSTPAAAAVADATWGLAKERHMPKGLMLSMGAKSIVFAMACPPHLGRGPTTASCEGALP